MKKYVAYSRYSIAITAIVLVVFSVCLVIWFKNKDWMVFSVLGCVFAGMLVCALIYAPVSVELTEDALVVHRPLVSKRIPLDKIASVRHCPPTMGEYRSCGSGGFFGYWGRFSDGEVGSYFAYYGKSSDCFLVTLHSGVKYVIGCSDGKEVEKKLEEQLH